MKIELSRCQQCKSFIGLGKYAGIRCKLEAPNRGNSRDEWEENSRWYVECLHTHQGWPKN